MRVEFLYDGLPGVDIEGDNFLGLFEPREFTTQEREEDIIARALLNPIGTRRIAEMARGRKKILIIVDDNTRLTPVAKILPLVIEELKTTGVAEDSITILIGLGTHRPMTQAECEKKLGEDVLRRFRVISHNWRDASSLEFTGKTPGGTEIWLNKEVLQADFILGIGHIVPHRVAGFSGGGKIIQPAVCGGRTTEQTHWLSARYQGWEIMGKPDNPVRQEIETVARQAGLDAILNVVQDRQGRIVGAFCGDLVHAHRAGCRVSLEVFGVEIPEPADIVLTDSYPADVEMWQAAKGIYASDLAVREGGVIILVTPCPEGVASQHPSIEKVGYRPLREVERLVKQGVLTDLTVAAHLVHVGEVIQKKASCILVSPGIGPEVAQKIGFKWAPTPREALEMAYGLLGRRAKVICFRHGGEILPVVAGGNIQ
ncbi:nickel-dependent lactate racemase [Moorella sulfitireducens (nom. illeg.)]|uniref:nickel-dependent lactate racemase n=1 Tax=Neomoorella sulfitireducens TaxID=2972948 RepID=UPI0021AC284C|nr:nickel-dependent lactate racemase [Moorella sulfitireducens]